LLSAALSRVRLADLPQVGSAALAKLAVLIQADAPTQSEGLPQWLFQNESEAQPEAQSGPPDAEAAAKAAAKAARGKLTVSDPPFPPT
jgi:hypothetical protein